MTTRNIEIGVGIFIAIGIGALLVLAMQVSNLGTYREGDTYEISAHFSNIGGLKVRAPVTLSGVRIGRVSEIRYDPQRYQALVVMSISKRHDYLPLDTQASIYTAGLLGEQYIALGLGGEDEVLVDGDQILFTQSAVVLEELIGRVLVNMTSN